MSFATARGLFTGVSGDSFAPDLPLDRGMLASVLHRLEDAPGADALPFADVDSGRYYAPAVAWAAGSGLMSGVGGGNFAPEQPALREQVAVVLYQYARLQGKAATPSSADLSGFADHESVSAWAGEAVAWCVESGLLRGRDNGRLDPQAPVSRAEMAALLERLIRL